MVTLLVTSMHALIAICTLAAPTLLAINSVFWPSIPALSAAATFEAISLS
jgi:hypothetical protein